MDFDWLKDFQALAEHGNFSRAADARHVTQPAFSRRIRALEDWVGTPLFIRGAQGAALSAAGKYFLPIARDMTSGLESARRETFSIGERQLASLSLAATHALSVTFFPGWIHRLVGLESVGTLNLVSDSMVACEQIMLSGEVHFLLCYHHDEAPAQFDADRFASIRVGGDSLIPICAPDDLGAPLWPIPGTREEPTPLLGYSKASGLGRILNAHPSNPSSPSSNAAVETVFTSDLAATLMTMAQEGRGVAWLPKTLVETDLQLGRLVKASSAAFDIPVEIRLFRSPDCRNDTADGMWEKINALHS